VTWRFYGLHASHGPAASVWHSVKRSCTSPGIQCENGWRIYI